MAWVTPKTDWNSSQQGVTDTDFNRIEGNIEHLANGSQLQDPDGNVYPTVVINGQQWAARNWESTKLADGTAIPEVTDASAWAALSTLAYCKYDNFITAFGLLYNHYAAIDSDMAPEGWRVATVADWEGLVTFLQGNGYAYDRFDYGSAGTNLSKSVATMNSWSGTAGTGKPGFDPVRNNESGLSIQPGGGRSGTGVFSSIEDNGSVWAYDAALPKTFRVLYNSADIAAATLELDVRVGRSIRMVRDL